MKDKEVVIKKEKFDEESSRYKNPLDDYEECRQRQKKRN